MKKQKQGGFFGSKGKTAKASKPPRVKKIANAEDAATGQAYEVYRFRKVGGEFVERSIPRADAQSAPALRKLLLDWNADLPEDSTTILKNAILAAPPELWLYAADLGWTDDDKSFVFRDAVLGQQQSSGRSLKPPLVGAISDGSFQVKGSLEAWKSLVAGPLAYSSRAMLATSAGFAAPLMKMVGIQPFGFNLFGEAKSGKTTILLAASSSFGVSAGTLPNWNATSVGLQETASAYTDLVLPLNEVGVVPGNVGQAHHHLRDFIMTFSEAQPKTRAKVWTASHPASRTTSWRGIMISTAEQSLDQYAELAKATRAAGEYARCLDVPALTPNGTTIFDKRPKNIPRKKFVKWSQNELQAVRVGIEQNHGHAMREFLAYILRKGGLAKRVAEYMDEFEAEVKSLALKQSLHHAARCFALIYAGGRIAISAKILPWKPDNLLKAIAKCFGAAVRRIRDPETDAIQILKKKVVNLRAWPKMSTKAEWRALEGYLAKTDGKAVVRIASTALHGWFSNPAQVRLVLDWLEREGHLIMRKSMGKATKAKGVEAKTRDVKWPDGSRRSTFEFTHPFLE